MKIEEAGRDVEREFLFFDLGRKSNRERSTSERKNSRIYRILVRFSLPLRISIFAIPLESFFFRPSIDE